MSLPPKITVINISRTINNVKGEVLLQIIVIFSSSISQRSGFKYDLFEIIVLYITLSE